MRDDQIADLLRTLEDDRVPDPAFADELHVTLAGMTRRRARRWPLVLLAAAAVLALAGGAAFGSGLIDPPVSVEATPTPSASIPPAATATATPSPTPSVAAASPTASPSAAQTPELTPTPQARPLDVLPMGSVIRATADGLRVRQGPSVTWEVAGTVNAGDLLYITPPADPRLAPLFADGHEWYPVEHAPGYSGWPIDASGQEDRIVGYVAARSATETFVELVTPDCPDTVDDIERVVALTPYERVACLGDDTISVEGTFGCPFCDSLSHPYRMEPAWLAAWHLRLDILVPSWARYPPFPGSIVLAVPPEVEPLDVQGGTILRVTGHFDDARSADCMMTPEPGFDLDAPHDEAVEWYCRERFVVESWEAIGTDPWFEARSSGDHRHPTAASAPSQDPAAIARMEPGVAEGLGQ